MTRRRGTARTHRGRRGAGAPPPKGAALPAPQVQPRAPSSPAHRRSPRPRPEGLPCGEHAAGPPPTQPPGPAPAPPGPTPLTFPATRPSRTMPNLKSVMARPALGRRRRSLGGAPSRGGAAARLASGPGLGPGGRTGRGWAGLRPPPPRARRTCHAPPLPPRAPPRAEPREGRGADTPPPAATRPMAGRAPHRPARAAARWPMGGGRVRRRSEEHRERGGGARPGAAPARPRRATSVSREALCRRRRCPRPATRRPPTCDPARVPRGRREGLCGTRRGSPSAARFPKGSGREAQGGDAAPEPRGRLGVGAGAAGACRTREDGPSRRRLAGWLAGPRVALLRLWPPAVCSSPGPGGDHRDRPPHPKLLQPSLGFSSFTEVGRGPGPP